MAAPEAEPRSRRHRAPPCGGGAGKRGCHTAGIHGHWPRNGSRGSGRMWVQQRVETAAAGQPTVAGMPPHWRRSPWAWPRALQRQQLATRWWTAGTTTARPRSGWCGCPAPGCPQPSWGTRPPPRGRAIPSGCWAPTRHGCHPRGSRAGGRSTRRPDAVAWCGCSQGGGQGPGHWGEYVAKRMCASPDAEGWYWGLA